MVAATDTGFVMKGPSQVDGGLIRRKGRLAFGHAEPDNSAVRRAVARSTMDHLTHLARPLSASEPELRRPIPSTFQAPQPIGDASLTVRGSAPRNNGQTADRQKPEFAGPFKIRTSATICGYYRTSSPVTALPMSMR
jgi:hypothetical protein